MKGKKGLIRRQLLRKNSEDQSEFNENNMMSFEMESNIDFPSEFGDKQRSYYQLNDNITRVNPYPF